MSTLPIRHAAVLVTMDDRRREIADGAVYIRDNAIEAVGTTAELPSVADTVLDASDQVVLPGLVNTHHHMFQTLTRAHAQDASLFGWLRTLYPIWAGLTPEMVFASTQTAMAELLLSGCTTTSDHLYLYPNGVRLEDSLEAAEQIGMRFHAGRGSMSVGESQGGLPPDRLVEPEAAILADTQRLIERWHDPRRLAMRRIVVAPCSPFSVSRGLMRDAALLARSYGAAHGVGLHTHLAENASDLAYTRAQFGGTPADYVEALGWTGPDVWCAHCVKLDPAGIALFGRSGTGVAHCPCSNLRLASGIAPIRAMRDAGVAVGLGVDGAASNDGSHLLAEARLAMLLQRVAGDDAASTTGALATPKTPGATAAIDPEAAPAALAMGAREMLEIATRGGARVLGRDDIGALAPGMAADLVTFALDGVATAGALHDPVAALLFCSLPKVRHSIVDGRFVVRDGQLLTVDLPRIVERHNRLPAALIDGA